MIGLSSLSGEERLRQQTISDGKKPKIVNCELRIMNFSIL